MTLEEDDTLAAVFKVERPIAYLAVNDHLENSASIYGFHARPNELCLVAGNRLDWS
jgi:hypothetical protein